MAYIHIQSLQIISNGGKIVSKELQLTCMTFIYSATGWFKIAEVPTCDLKSQGWQQKIYIDKSSARISQLFKNLWLSRYPRPIDVVSDNGSEFKKDFPSSKISKLTPNAQL